MPELPLASASAAPLSSPDELYPIREVARLTGVNPVTLRAWERRYGLIQPLRTDSGHRLYSPADIDAVRSILAWIERGVAVSKVGQLLARSAPQRVASSGGPTEVGGEWREWQLRVRRAVASFDETRLERLYGQVFSAYPPATAFQEVLLPVWQELLLCQDGFGQASEWLFLDTFLRGRVLQRLHLLRGQSDERVLLAPLPGRCHELELLVTALLLAGNELAVGLLGPGQPFDELPLVCEKVRPRALVLFSNCAPDGELPRRLARLEQTLECPLALVGDVAELVEDALVGTAVACLGGEARLLQRRLRQFLSGRLEL